jgi:hypothetical protein
MEHGDSGQVVDGATGQASETMSDEASVRRWWRCAECGEPVVGDRLTAGQREQPLCAGCRGTVQPVTWTEWHLGDRGKRWTSGVELSEELLPVGQPETQRLLAEWMEQQLRRDERRAHDDGGET